MKRKALGKGLRSLIPEAPPRAARTIQAQPAVSGDGLQRIDLDRIHPNRGQPRQVFEPQALEELALSLKRDGVLQPVVVRPLRENEFELVAGERRWRAAQIAGLLKIPAIVKEVPDNRLLELALIENLQREELNPIEEATAYQTLINDLGLTQDEVAQRVGKKRPTVTNALRLLNLHPDVQRRVQEGRLSAGHAKVLAGLTNAKLQVELAERIVREDLSVRKVESILSGPSDGPGATSSSRASAKAQRDPNVVAAEEALQRAVGTKVKIVGRGKGGRLELYYYSDEELDRIYQLLVGSVSGNA